jgi:Na+/proline symporter
MAATTFAADTPLAITEFVRQHGIWQNWFWWSAVPLGLLSIFLFSRLWRRAEVLTENELIELRYAGPPAAFLRGFKALFFATIYNLTIMGWVLSAMTSITAILVDVDPTTALWACAGIALFYAMLSGFYGVVVTDVIQFGVAMLGAYLLAFLSVRKLGGVEAVVAKLSPSTTAFFPPLPEPGESFWLSPFLKVIVLITMAWWCRFDVDGGGYIVQRMSAAKNERHSVWATLWFYFLFYVGRAWPWVLVALASMVAFPDVSSYALGDKAAYPLMIRDFLGPGMKGLLVVSFLAAFMSTIDTHLNWGASYLVHDLYRRFIKTDASPRHYVLVSQASTVLMMVLAVGFASQMNSISKAWEFLTSMGAGAGVVMVLRWFWWRVNAWSEISAMASSIGISLGLEFLALWQHRAEGGGLFAHAPVIGGVPLEFHLKLLVIVPISLSITALVTFMTAAENEETLRSFYQRVGPGGWWKPEHSQGVTLPPVTTDLWSKLLLGAVFLWAGIFGGGHLTLGRWSTGALWLAVSIIALIPLLRKLERELEKPESGDR